MWGLNQKSRIIRRFWLYVIALEQGKYYVGITFRKDPYQRINEHGTRLGAEWTRKYKPLKPLKPIRLGDLGTISMAEAERLEKAAFEELRRQYGLKNVRGGNVTSRWTVYRIGNTYFGYRGLSVLVSLVLAASILGLVYYIHMP